MKNLILSLTVLLVTLFSVNNIHADDFSDAIIKAKKKLNEAANNGDTKGLIKVRGDFERILQLKKNQWLVNYYMAYTDLMMSYMSMMSKDNDAVKKYNESAIDLLNKSTDAKDDFSEAWILKIAAQGGRWGYEPDKMNDIIAKITEAKDMAKKLEPENPRYYIEDGNGLFYTPESFGGGPDKALPDFQKSWDLFQTYKIKDETYPDWGKDVAAGMIALCYVQTDKLDEAKNWIAKGLDAVPDSGFIKNYVQKQYDDKAKK